MREFYLLVKKQIKSVEIHEWASGFEDKGRFLHKARYVSKRTHRYANPKTPRAPCAQLSSVFIGMPGEIFETMFFCEGHALNYSAFRSDTWEGCRRMHRRVKSHIEIAGHRWLVKL